MKRRIFVFFTIVVTAWSYLPAQLVKGFGVKIGTAFADQSWQYVGTPEWPTTNRLGFTANAFVELFDHSCIGGVIEIQYTQKGMTQSVPITTQSQPEGTGQFITVSPRVDYISIPILAKLRYPESFLSPYVFAGPRIDCLIYKQGNGYDAVIDKFKTVELGATIGAGIEVESPLPVSVLAEFRYDLSFAHSFQNDFLSVTNHSFGFVIGFRI
jgi:hypothetical protein